MVKYRHNKFFYSLVYLPNAFKFMLHIVLKKCTISFLINLSFRAPFLKTRNLDNQRCPKLVGHNPCVEPLELNFKICK